MSLPLDLAGATREELIEITGQLLSHIKALEARVAELEGQQKPPTDAGKERKPSWVKANRPTRPKKERKKRTHGFARRREEPIGIGPPTDLLTWLCPEAGGAHPPGGARHSQLS